ncbi:MAG: type II secretion system F family protein [Dehalococcoidia bacterium]
MLIAVISVCVAVTGVLYALLNRPASVAQRRLAGVSAAQMPRINAPAARERDRRPPRGEALRAQLRQMLPSRMFDRLGALLLAAGMATQPETYALCWAALAVGLPALYLLTAGRSSSGMGQTQLILLGVLTGIGLYLPLTFVRSRVKKRHKLLSRALPDSMDLLTTCVEAGLGIDAALARVAEKAKEPLGAEIRMILRTMGMGRPRREALEQFAVRNALPEIRSFVSAVIQAEMMGVSLGHVLRVQTEALRVQRRQKAEQCAQKAPVKIIIVLALFIFPAMFIVILGPAALSFMNGGVL